MRESVMQEETDKVNNSPVQWSEKWEQCRPFLEAYAIRLTNRKAHDAEDLVHDTYCRAVDRVKEPEKIKNFQAYLYRMMRNVWINRCKHERRSLFVSLEVPTTQQLVSQQY